MAINRVILLGNAGKDAELRYTASGSAVASFSLATSEKYKKKGGEWEEKTEWHNITVWGKLAGVCSEYVKKGKELYLEGRLQTRKWQDKDGKDRYTTEIVSETVKFVGGGNSTRSADNTQGQGTGQQQRGQQQRGQQGQSGRSQQSRGGGGGGGGSRAPQGNHYSSFHDDNIPFVRQPSPDDYI